MAPLNKIGTMRKKSYPPPRNLEKISLYLDIRNWKREREVEEAAFCTQIETETCKSKKYLA